MKIIFTGGGTGGHIFPIIAIVRELRKLALNEKLEIYYLGPKDEFGDVFLSQEGIKVKNILAGKIRRYFNFISLFQNIFDIFLKTPLGIFQSFLWLLFKNPDLIFSKGGFGSFPVVFSGWVLGIPIFLHESDISPGLANRILSKFALKIFTSFPRTEYFSPKKIYLVGNPIRKEILEGKKEEAKRIFQISGEKKVVLILGGSQGAQRINEKVLEILPDFLKEFEIIHQCGDKNYQKIKLITDGLLKEDLKKYYHLFGFLKEDQLKLAYAISDLIISRAGSGSIFEIAALAKPSILIPLPEAAQDHQIKNAYAFKETGATIVIEEANLTPRFFFERAKFLLQNPKEIEKMSQAAKEFSKPLAAKIIASYILEYLTPH
jgi:UDP-N-acetylglucosamine--N-acetylmuramyl-(pentapeptide) pyrophosphoryl-undecaprenol N-acetylglucosamine transferase